MTRLEFFDALRTVQSEEFAQIPADFEHTFSPEFERRMDKLIRNQRRKSWHLVNTRAKRIAILAAVLILLFLTACAVPTVRETVKDFFLRSLGDRYELVVADDSVSGLDKVFSFRELPQGFELTGGYEYPNMIEREYTDTDGAKWYLIQHIPRDLQVSYSKEKGQITQSKLGDGNLYFYSRNGFTYAVWMKKGYLMELYCYKDADRDTMQRLIEMIE